MFPNIIKHPLRKYLKWVYNRWFRPPEEHRWHVVYNRWFPVRIERFEGSVMVVLRTNRIYWDSFHDGTYTTCGEQKDSGFTPHPSEVLIPIEAARKRYGEMFIQYLFRECDQ